ncbi:elongator complex protein 4 [Patella vulgata]|uniref:elongator complex protein 4 n=1 Tax=Patella vulgata TaxID=6465 RepID=UPI00217F8F43|nr:elongator complex protein 4 [Patella vulgata]
MATKTNFQKKARGKLLQIPGTRPSLYNNQLLVSTGVPSLDHVLGGGVAVGTVLMIEEDVFGDYARLLVKYFTAEAVMTGQPMMLASLDVEPEDLIKDLPAPIIDERKEEDKTESSQLAQGDDSMKIAWRYQNLPKFQSNPTGIKFGHYYDLTKTMEKRLVESIDIKCLSTTQLNQIKLPVHAAEIMNINYMRLLNKIAKVIEEGKYLTKDKVDKRNILKIAIHSLGSPMWGENSGLKLDGTGHDPSLPRFLLGLRALLRSSFAVCLLTVPTHLFQENSFTRQVEKFCDTVLHLESFSGSEKEKNPVFKEYHGLLNIHQLPRLNTMAAHEPDTLDLAFKLRRKKFTIEPLHLPPEMAEQSSQGHEDPLKHLKSSTAGCGGGTGNSKLDF